jgi:hypothetical protein
LRPGRGAANGLRESSVSGRASLNTTYANNFMRSAQAPEISRGITANLRAQTSLPRSTSPPEASSLELIEPVP